MKRVSLLMLIVIGSVVSAEDCKVFESDRIESGLACMDDRVKAEVYMLEWENASDPHINIEVSDLLNKTAGNAAYMLVQDYKDNKRVYFMPNGAPDYETAAREAIKSTADHYKLDVSRVGE